LTQAGDILIAKPFLQDGYFKRSVIYVGEHNEHGSIGFVLNKPHGLILRDIFPQLNKGNFRIYEGGPVASQELFYTHTLGLKLSDSIEISKGVYMGGDFNELSHLIEHGKISSNQIRFYVGHAGWSPGQLNNEILHNSWFVEPANYDDLITIHTDDMWGNELLKINPSYKAFSDFSFDPSLN
jgi:putative transcriptional regulator